MSIIKNNREKAGFTQKELSKKTGLSLRTIQRLESSNKEPKGHSLIVLSQIFNISPSDLKEQYQNIEQTKETETIDIKLINLSVLACLGIPFGNLILPFVLWNKRRESKRG